MALKVLYKLGTREAYRNLSERQPNALYWLNDVRELRLGDDLYSGGVRVVDSYDMLPSVSLAAAETLYLCEDTGNGYVVNSDFTKWIPAVHGVDGETLEYNESGLIAVKALPIAKVTGLEDRLQAIEKATVESINVKGSDEISVAEDGTLELAAVPIEKVTDLEGRLESLQTQINTIVNNPDTEGVINSINEFTQYVEEHGELAEGFRADIDANKKAIEDLVAVDETLIAKDEAYAVTKLVNYEISHKPVGTLVNYSDEEVRVMCPADTAWTLQQSGEGSDADKYYIGFKAYAPADAVSFKEDLAEIIADETMYYFEDNEFAGVDEYGRKYSIVWLPVAVHADGVWTYYGAKSTNEKYIGWHYSVEWFNADGVKIAADTIRINLSNEDCHNNSNPYYLGELQAAFAEMEESYTWGEI